MKGNDLDETPVLEFEIKIEVTGDPDGLAAYKSGWECPTFCSVLRGFPKQRGTFRVSDPNLSVLVDDGKHANGAGNSSVFSHCGIGRCYTLALTAV